MTSALETFSQIKMLPRGFLQRHGLSEERSGGIRIAYGPDGRERIRKNPQSAHPTPWVKDDERPMHVFGHHLVPQMAAGANRTLLIVEGESDAITAWFHRFPALGIPGATMWKLLTLGDVEWSERVAVVREPGIAAESFVAGVAAHVGAVGYSGVISTITLDYKDISDLHVALGGDRNSFATALDVALAAATPVTPVSAPRPTRSSPSMSSMPSIVERVTVYDVLAWGGFETPNQHGFLSCPLHVERSASFHVVGDNAKGFKCFGCGARGGVLDLAVALGITRDHAEAARWLEGCL